MAQRFSDDDDAIAELNVIPLVDIILVVLIIFMVTAPMVMKPTIDINLPKASTGEENKQPSAITVTISPNGDVLFNSEKATIEQVYEKSLNAVGSQPDTAAILVADKGVTLDKLTEVVDAVRRAGVKKVAFSIEKK